MYMITYGLDSQMQKGEKEEWVGAKRKAAAAVFLVYLLLVTFLISPPPPAHSTPTLRAAL